MIIVMMQGTENNHLKIKDLKKGNGSLQKGTDLRYLKYYAGITQSTAGVVDVFQLFKKFRRARFAFETRTSIISQKIVIYK
jgi:hypothetical protein